MRKYGIQNTTGIIVLKIIQLLLLVSIFGVMIFFWKDVPDQVALHFDLMGNPNRWGSKDRLWALPIIATLLYGLLRLVACFPSMWNMPGKIREEKQQETYQCMYTLLEFLMVVLLGIFFYATLTSVFDLKLTVWFMVIMFSSLGFPLLYTILHIRKLNREV